MKNEKNLSSLNILFDNVEGTNLLLEYYYGFSKRIFKARDFRNIVRGLYEELRKIYLKQKIELILWENNKDLVHFHYHSKKGRVIPSHEIQEKNTLYHYVLQERQAVLTNNYVNFCENLDLHPHNLKPKSWIGIPMLVKDKVLGMVVLWDENPEHYFRLQDKQFLTTIANIIGFAVENISLYDFITEEKSSERILSDILPPVSLEGHPGSLTGQLLHSLLRSPEIQYAGFYLRSQSHDKWRLIDEAIQDPDWISIQEEIKTGLIYLPEELFKTTDSLFWQPGKADRKDQNPELQAVFEEVSQKYRLGPVQLLLCAIHHYYYGVFLVIYRETEAPDLVKTEPYVHFVFSVLSQLVEKNILLDHKKSYESYIKQLEKLKIVGELASGSAHHLNNILSVISGRTQILLKKLSDSPFEKDLKMVAQAAEDGALAVRRLQSLKTKDEEIKNFQILDLNDLLLEVVEIVRPRFERQAQSNGITYDVKLTLGSIPSVTGDPAGLREVFLNVINNALDAMPEGGKLTLQTTYEKKKVLVFVSDTGVGISDDMREKIFEPFFSTKGDQGNGLGLSIAAEIIAGHNGKIYVDSIAEKGSIFMVQLPAAGEKPDNRKSTDSQNDKFKYKVLLVDDENAVGDTLAEMLRGEGCEVILVNNPKEALVNFIKNDCDVVLTDLSMPDINGYELARKIKSMRKDIPVILITGWDQKSQDVNQDIIDGVIQKPFNIDQIRQEFHKVLENNGRS